MLTKDESIDLKTLIENITQRALDEHRAQMAHVYAKNELADFLWKLQNQKPVANHQPMQAVPAGNEKTAK